MPASREARPTIRFVDEYCQLYEGLFPEVRSYEAFKLLHLGMISEVKRKSLPAIAKAVGLDNQQNLHHFLSESPWQAQQLRMRRLDTFSNGTTEVRYMAEVIYGQPRRQQYWLLTTDPATLPDNSTSFVRVAAPAIKLSEIGDSYGFRTWIEYGLKQSKDALGLSPCPSVVCSTSLIEQSERLEALTQQLALDHSTVDLFQLAPALVRRFPDRFP
jgi:SRSO17 transposase